MICYDGDPMMNRRGVLSWLAAVLYVAAGAMHFAHPGPYLKIMPNWVPWPEAAVWISGLAEILGGIGMAVPKLRRMAAWWLVALLVAVFPANLNMALHPTETGAAGIPALALWIRLPVQALLIWWVLWCSTPKPGRLLHHLVH
jgi:uncharacterized membrane protein